MRSQMKFYLALLAVILLQGSIFSNTLETEIKTETETNAETEIKAETEIGTETESKTKAQIEAETEIETETETETKDVDTRPNHDEHDLSEAAKKECKEGITETAEINATNDPKKIPFPINTRRCRDPKQKKSHYWSIMGNCSRNKFHDVGVNSEGAIVAIGADGRLYWYEYDMNIFEVIEGDYQIQRLRRVDIGYDGLIYVLNWAGDTYYLSCTRYWVKLPGCAIDIGTGRGDEVVKIGCNDYCEPLGTGPCPKNFENPFDNIESPYVYRLICKCDCRCCKRRCNIFVKYVFTCEKDIDRLCYWIKYPNGPSYKLFGKYFLCTFARIDANSSGYPMVLGRCNKFTTKIYNKIWQMVGGDKNVYKNILTFPRSTTKRSTLRDLCGDNYGNIFYIKRNGNSNNNASVYIYNSSGSDVLVINTTSKKIGFNISCGPYAQPTVTTKDCCLYTTTKVGYN